MKGVLISVFIILTILNLLGQQKSMEPNKISYSVFAAGGRSIFRSTIDSPTDSPSKFPTTEIRIGGSVTFRISRQLDILSRLDFGAKLGGKKYNEPGKPFTVAGPFIELEKMAGTTHYFFEIPVMIQYRFPHPNLIVGLGLNYRKFFNQDGIDSFSSRNELGAIGRVGYRLNPKFTVGIEYCIALTKIYKVGGIFNGEEYKMSTRNEFGQITLDYKLNFQKKK